MHRRPISITISTQSDAGSIRLNSLLIKVVLLIGIILALECHGSGRIIGHIEWFEGCEVGGRLLGDDELIEVSTGTAVVRVWVGNHRGLKIWHTKSASGTADRSQL